MVLDFEKPLQEIEAKISDLTRQNADPSVKLDGQIVELKKEWTDLRKKIYSGLTPWQTVQVARHPERPTIRDYIKGMCSEFIELHGDRCFGDDKAIIGGLATIDKHKVMLIGHQKGKTVDENVKTNFGMGVPDGYRKALRLMKLAEKYGIPVVTLVDTPGAYPGIEGEARGQAEAIAHNLAEMSSVRVPIITVVTGEGGSGGAIGIGMGDVVLMLSHSVYSVISPEGCASILWRDGAKAPEAAEALKVTAPSLLELGIIDDIVPEPPGGAHSDPESAIAATKSALLKHLGSVSRRKVAEKRYAKYAEMGRFRKRRG
jgi:acetyl-CoA carboxylase carboxyl transferase subunit alpha